jgi:hypothetical protein
LKTCQDDFAKILQKPIGTNPILKTPATSLLAETHETLFTLLKRDNWRAEVFKKCGNIIMHLERAKIWPAWHFF